MLFLGVTPLRIFLHGSDLWSTLLFYHTSLATYEEYIERQDMSMAEQRPAWKKLGIQWSPYILNSLSIF